MISFVHRRCLCWKTRIAAMLLITVVSAAQGVPRLTTAPATRPAVPPSATVNMDLNSVGDADVTVRIRNVSNLFTPAMSQSAKFAPAMLRLLGLDHNYYEPQDLSSIPVAEIAGYKIEYKLPGLARPNAGGGWEVPVIADIGPGSPLIGANAIIFFSAANSDGTLQSLRLSFPADCTGLRLSQDRHSVTFNLPAAVAKGDVSKADFRLDARPRMMACLAKSYGYEQFPQLWVGRASFTNTGTASLPDYWVRFRLGDYAAGWSQWRHCGPVLPGQTIVNAYFPLLDVDKMARIEGTRQTHLDAEYVYKTGDGKVVSRSSSQKLQILGHNDIILNESGLDVVLASFTTKDDPVVQRIAAMVCRQMPGGINPSTNEGAIRFMEQLYRFMLHNQIVYQTPPGEGSTQHVKYCRDVMLNRAGTCIDLAIFYASVCEAVGLDPVLYLPPGHCFPGVRLPRSIKNENGKLINAPIVAIETTMLKPGSSFPDAVAEGINEQQAMLKAHNGQVVDIAQMRTRGVNSLELPALAENILESVGVTPAPLYQSIAGCWSSTLLDRGQMFTLESEYNENSQATVEITGLILTGGVGHYTYDGTHYAFASSALKEEGAITWIDADHFVWKCTSCSDPLLNGRQIYASRQRDRHLNFAADIAARVPAFVPPAPIPAAPFHPVAPDPEVVVDPLPERPRWLAAQAKLTGHAAQGHNGEAGWNIHVGLHVDNGRGVPCDVVIRFRDITGAPLRMASGKTLMTVLHVTPLYDHTNVTDMDVFIPYANLPRPWNTSLVVVYVVEVHRASDGMEISNDPQSGSFIAPGGRR